MESTDRTIVPVDPTRNREFYLPIILEDALIKACRKRQASFERAANNENDSLLTQEQAFHCFRGGNTVTAFTIVNHADGPEYILASNQRTKEQLEKTKEFVQGLLEYVRDNPDNLNRKPFLKKVLWRILLWNLPRVDAYLSNLVKALSGCIADCLRRQDTCASSLVRQLEELQRKVEFPRDIESSDNALAKFLSDCESLIKAIHASANTELDEAIRHRARDGEMSNSEPWCELRHYLGRFHSYRQAAEIIIGAFKRWPLLFEGFKVVPIPSSLPMQKPVARSMEITATDVIRQIMPEQDLTPYKPYIEDLQNFDLDRNIRAQLAKRDFKPIVHCEVLIHDYLLTHDLTLPSEFWNNWKYIGSSKRTCRLCQYYFNAHTDKVEVRASHQNLYPKWRLPDIYEYQRPQAVEERDEIMAEIIEHIRRDALTTLQEKLPRGKRHDSNTQSGMPKLFEGQFSESTTVSSITSQLSRMAMSAGIPVEITSVKEEDDNWSVAGNLNGLGEHGEKDDSSIAVA
ncbi:hypothetical protein EDB81DRAFT_913064 [Dactylonectria macrodidyma]|uniref:Uncharacterized protein n=1 Tax=Dactylonectria macrodidyma TaxID=307937 RepID=A0A9P9DP01_9HYPO|nr:hypothetical protein EDB81DRAFT_913064 [Dactylonectria macrodidyma]